MITISIIFLIIILIIILIYFQERSNVTTEMINKLPDVINIDVESSPDNNDDEILTDENGRKYKNVNKFRNIQRKTYIKGRLTGKFWGEQDLEKSESYLYSNFFDFKIYEAQIYDANYSLQPFEFSPDAYSYESKLPPKLPCKIVNSSIAGEYEIILHEPKISVMSFDRKLQQNEGKEVFGVVNSEITGFIIDSINEKFVERKYIFDENDANEPKDIEIFRANAPTKTLVPTGKIEYKDDYKRHEYFYSDNKQTYWGNWIYYKTKKSNNREGCFLTFSWILAVILGICFLIYILPQLIIFLPFLVVPLLFGLIPTYLWHWILRIVGFALLLFFIFSIYSAIVKGNKNNNSSFPYIKDTPKERKSQFVPILDTMAGNIKDSLIMHFREWKDYNGNIYSGHFWVKKSSYSNSKNYKINLNISNTNSYGYDEMLFKLNEHDKNSIGGLYQLFDSIKKENNLNNSLFSEMIVSFVQDIPYSMILPYDCDPNSYSDSYIRSYLSSPDARCDGNEKFGINTPVEFLATLNGDCDTRTLLLYNILAHYGYDVAILSSKQYSHSILGVNLNYSGAAYYYKNRRYVLWETTANNFKPGVLPKEISNTNYWRISLKSK